MEERAHEQETIRRRSINEYYYSKRKYISKINNYTLNNFEKEKDIEKNGKVTDLLKPNQFILVQVIKEPISTKGPRLTTEISIAGRYMILIPFSDKVSISQKIEDQKEQKRLKQLIETNLLSH